MNERDIELVNKVAEMTPDVYNTKYDNGMKCIEFTEDALQKFANLIRADEREECAKVCEERIEYWQRDDIRASEDEV
jgi:hypothetical protein